MKWKTSKIFIILTVFAWIVLFLFINGAWTTSLGGEPRKIESSKKFYIYQWNESIVDSWPTEYIHHRLSVDSGSKLNCAVGKLVNFDAGLYQTHQYSLFRIFVQRLLESQYRTEDPAEASVFFIPYDLGMDSSTRSSDGSLFQTSCPRVDFVLKQLTSSPYFQRSHGHNHFILHTINQMMVYYANKPCTKLYDLCFNCTKLSIDVYPPGTYSYLDDTPYMTNKWISIPFPSNFHQHPMLSAANYPWKQLLSISEDDVKAFARYKTDRPFSVCFLGSNAVTATKQKKLRELIMSECGRRGNPLECLLVPLDSHFSTVNISQNVEQLLGSLHHAEEGALTAEITEAMRRNLYSACRLCLMPGGDFPTRKGVLDAMLSGCVPVTFQLSTAQQQWPWHWGSEATALNATMFTPREEFMRQPAQKMGEWVAASRSAEVMMSKLRTIQRIGSKMQYRLPVSACEEVQVIRPIAHFKSASPQQRGDMDAIDVILERLLT